jgi:predicted amino acid dehydrogenase
LEFDQTLEIFSDVELENLVNRWNDMVEPFVVAGTRITSKTGATAYGEFICVSRTSEELMNFPKEQILAELSAAVNVAKERGAKIVGLGAYTSVVTKGGRDLRNLGVALTTGNSYTVSSAVDATLEAARRLETPIERTIAAVVGATGSIGRNTAIFLAEKVNSLILIGNPLNQAHSRRRLMKLVAEIYQHLNNNQIKDGGAIYQFVKEHPRIPAPDAPLEDYLSFAEMELEESPIIYTVEIENYLHQADVVVTATSQVNSLITPKMLKYGAVVCDVSRPPDVSYEVKEARPDVLVIDGGVIVVPGCPDLGWNFGFEPGQAYACMSETMMLALEHHYQHFGLGTDISAATVDHTRKLAEKHGFKLAGFRSFDRPLSEESWKAVIKARMKRQEPSVVSL